MADQKNKIMDSRTERSLNAECLVLEMSGQTWHVPFDALQGIPRVGETVRLAGGSAGKVAEVEYEFVPEGHQSNWRGRCPPGRYTRTPSES